MAAKIMIDAGHGGYDSGATFEGRREKDDNLRLALAVGDILSSRGFDVAYTRTEDVYNSPIEKANIANNSGADFFVSMHRNSSPYPNTYSGVETLVYDDSGIKAQMARNVNSELEKVGFNNLGVSVRPDLAVLRKTNMPSILIEAGFINSYEDNRIFDQNFQQIANAIANGIENTITAQAPRYEVQVGLFRNYANAQTMLNRVQELGYNGKIVSEGPYYAVRVGNVGTLSEARELESQLNRQGFGTLIVTV